MILTTNIKNILGNGRLCDGKGIIYKIYISLAYNRYW